MKKILFSILTLVLGLVLSGSDCSGPDPVPDPSTTDAGVKIGDVTWATRNVGAFGKFAATPEDPGMLYQWNNKTAWPATGPALGWNSSWSSSAATWQPANDPCPTGWRVPTNVERTALRNAPNAWDAVKKGRLFGTAANTIFLPAGGGRKWDTGNIHDVGTLGFYWSNDSDGTETATGLYFSSGDIATAGGVFQANAYSVRCVKI